MIAEIGHLALALALGLALLGGTLPLIGAQIGDLRLQRMASPLALGLFLFVCIAIGALGTGYVTSDFSIENVARNSHTLKPLMYKIAGVWGNHEGSLLLWAFMLTGFGAAIAVFGRRLPLAFRARALSIQTLIAVGFLLFMLLTSNPFARLDPAPLDGNGLNPLLQDPGLVFHPPMLYLGYVGFSVAFSFAIAALIEGEITATWAKWVRPWTLFAWTVLTGGVALGSWWAYYELGWGGWWFWDPVENASFMPWLAGTALMHSVIVVERRESLKSWTVLLAILTFSFSLLGTFLVRSGVITSVHAFASDPARGVFILAFLVIVVGGSLTLYALRGPNMRAGGLFTPLSREGALVGNNMLLAAAAGVVLVGTLAPLILDAFAGYKITVAAPFFNFAVLVIAPLLVSIMAIGPLLAWRRGKLKPALKRLRFAAAVMLLGFGLTLVLAEGAIVAALGIAMGLWVTFGVFADLAGRVKSKRGIRGTLARVRGLPLSQWGVTFGHLGLALVIFAITASEAWTTEKLVILKPGETTQVGAYSFTLEGVEALPGPNYTALRGTFRVEKSGQFVTRLYPEERTFTAPPMQTTEAAIYPMIAGDLYAVIGNETADGRWASRLYMKPLLSWMWAGVLMMMTGGLMSLFDQRLRIAVGRRTPTTGPGPAPQPAPQAAE